MKQNQIYQINYSLNRNKIEEQNFLKKTWQDTRETVRARKNIIITLRTRCTNKSQGYGQYMMKKVLVAIVVFVITLFAAQNANGQEMVQQTNENAFVLAQTENLDQLISDEISIFMGTPIEIISTSETVISSNGSCRFGVGRYSGEVSIHYYNDCNYDIKIGFKYKFKKCCPNCDCQWSPIQTSSATLSRDTPRQRYGTLKQGSNQSMTYYFIEFWEK
jgi:hypothetical protein